MCYLVSGILFPSDSAASFLDDFLTLLHRHAPDFYPVKCGSAFDEQLPVKFASNEQRSILGQFRGAGVALAWQGRNKCRGTCISYVMDTTNKTQLTIAMDLPLNAADKVVASLIQTYRDSCALVRVEYGWIHPLTIPELKRHGTSMGVFNVGPTHPDLFNGIPNLTWGAILGKAYVDMIAQDSISASPVHRVEEWPGGAAYIQLTESILAPVNSFEAFEAVRVAAIEHLGKEYFRSNDADHGPARVPSF